jgi:hypothetical protein
MFLRGNPKREKTMEWFFLYVFKNYIHWQHQLLLFFSTTGRRLQPPSLSGYNLREAPTPQFFGYNQKEGTTPYVLHLQMKSGYNHLYVIHIFGHRDDVMIIS